MSIILVFDPGDSTGYTVRSSSSIFGGTVVKDLAKIRQLIVEFPPDVVVYETFNLYPGKGKSLTRNDFYAVQVIGAIKSAYLEARADHRGMFIVGLPPACKRYSGGLDDRWLRYVERNLPEDVKATEHQKDSYLLLRYFERNIEPTLSMPASKYFPKTL